MLIPGLGLAQSGGIVAAPSAAAYSDLTKVSDRILDDLRATLPEAKTIVLYNATLFSSLPYYSSTADLVKLSIDNLCAAETGSVSPRVTPTVDLGTAAQGLSALIQVTIPTYTVQGQNLNLDNSALVGSFATAAKAGGYVVVNPDYLLPNVSQKDLKCSDFRASDSLADLWKFANKEAAADQSKAASKKPLKDALDSFHKLKDALTASGDKGPALVARALSAETLATAVEQPASVAVIDMRLDAANVDSTTKSLLWWRKTRFSANVAAHYWILSVRRSGTQLGTMLVKPGSVNILTKNLNLATYRVNGVP